MEESWCFLQQNDPPLIGTIQGVVRLQETGEAVADAQVLLVVIDSEAIDFIAETQSDGTGFYQFPGVPPDAYKLLADAP